MYLGLARTLNFHAAEANPDLLAFLPQSEFWDSRHAQPRMVFELEHGVFTFILVFIPYYWEGCAWPAGGWRSEDNFMESVLSSHFDAANTATHRANLPACILCFPSPRVQNQRLLCTWPPPSWCLEPHLREFNVLAPWGGNTALSTLASEGAVLGVCTVPPSTISL